MQREGGRLRSAVLQRLHFQYKHRKIRGEQEFFAPDYRLSRTFLCGVENKAASRAFQIRMLLSPDREIQSRERSSRSRRKDNRGRQRSGGLCRRDNKQAS